MNTLIVDDQQENRYLLEALLKGNGHDVQSVANGAEALERLKSGGIDLIVSDILMPVMDGFELCRRVKTDEGLRHIPFVVYTATYTGPQDEAFAFKIGADRFIQKPCEPDVFMEAIREVMASDRRMDMASTPLLEEEIFKLYSERLVRKLEQKMLELEKEVKRRQEAEETLRTNEQKYRLLADNTLDVIWAMSPELVFTYVNPAIRDLTGFLPEEWIGSRLPEHCDAENLAKIVEVIAQEIARGPDGSGVILEAEMLKKNREPVQIEIHGKAIFDENRVPILLQGTSRDISERKRSEKLLRESQEKYKSILDNIEDGYYEVDLAGNFTFFNHSACRILGYSSSELMGMNNKKYMDPENARKVFQTFNRVFTTGESFRAVDWEVVTKGGMTCHLDTSVSLVKDADGNVSGFRGIVRDVTERRNAEKEKIRLTEQLQQAQKMESIGRLAGGVAHDFNNLLSIILGYGEIVLESLDRDHPHHEMLELIYQAGIRAKELTRQLLAFSRKQVLEMQVVDVNDIVAGFEKLLRRMIGEDIQMVLSLTAEPLTVKADTAQLEQVLMNLAVNARDAMPGGGILTIETAFVELDDAYAEKKPVIIPGIYAMIGVSDTGCGMTKDILGSIFEPFFTTKSRDKGTGLGLATSYGIIKQHGGNIWVYSEPDKGTVFKIYLPLCAEKEGVKALPAKLPPPVTGSATVLIVEDDPSVRKLASLILSDHGYTTVESDDVTDAITKAAGLASPIHLVLTDVIMPHMKGPEVYAKVCENHPEARVLYMSGYTDSMITCLRVLNQQVQFVQKPFTAKSLLEKCHKVLHGV